MIGYKRAVGSTTDREGDPMTPPSRTNALDGRVRAAWQTQLAAAVKTPGLLPQLM